MFYFIFLLLELFQTKSKHIYEFIWNKTKTYSQQEISFKNVQYKLLNTIETQKYSTLYTSFT